MVREEFLHYIWKYRMFDTEYLSYRENRIEVLDTGLHNHSSGPDFFSAKIRIGSTLWAGNVEIHVKASDWFRHNHQADPAYDNIILHLVYDPDMAVYRKNGEEIPFARLAFYPGLLKKYKELIQNTENRECYRLLGKMEAVFYRDWMGKLGMMRLERRVNDIHERLKENCFDWDETLYQLLAGAFGANRNHEPFLLLSRAVPLKFIYRYRQNPLILNAAFFGQAGFLDEVLTDDTWYSQLQREYRTLQKVLPDPLPGKHLWKTMRARPASFPAVRIPQLISLVKNSFPLMENLLKMTSAKEIIRVFSGSIEHYWTGHFLYGISGRRPEYMPSPETCRLWIMNAVVPMVFCYGKLRNKQELVEQAMGLLEQLPPESNEIITKWKPFQVHAKNAFDSQSLIELSTRFCQQGRCTDCMVGHRVLSGVVKR